MPTSEEVRKIKIGDFRIENILLEFVAKRNPVLARIQTSFLVTHLLPYPVS